MTNTVDVPGHDSAAQWQTRVPWDLSELAQARVEAINLVQWPARIASSFVAEDALELRTALDFCPDDAVIVTRQFEKKTSLEMRLPTLEMQFLENGKRVPHVFDPQDHSPAEVEAWLLVELLHRGLDRDKFSKELPYAIPGLMSGDAEDYSPHLCRQGLIQLTALFQDAAAILDASMRVAGGGGIRVVCLAQTLNLTTVSDPQGRLGDFAFSPGDADNPEPYFYFAAGMKKGLLGEAARPGLKASTLIAESDPMAAAFKLDKLRLV